VCLDNALKPDPLVAAITEGFALGMTATAERERCATAESKHLAILIHKLDLTFDHQRAVIGNSNLYGCHSNIPL
jgi:hypothetical protein